MSAAAERSSVAHGRARVAIASGRKEKRCAVWQALLLFVRIKQA
jgi:hypothetical protein